MLIFALWLFEWLYAQPFCIRWEVWITVHHWCSINIWTKFHVFIQYLNSCFTKNYSCHVSLFNQHGAITLTRNSSLHFYRNKLPKPKLESLMVTRRDVGTHPIQWFADKSQRFCLLWLFFSLKNYLNFLKAHSTISANYTTAGDALQPRYRGLFIRTLLS